LCLQPLLHGHSLTDRSFSWSSDEFLSFKTFFVAVTTSIFVTG
jgi:hypothetical protein